VKVASLQESLDKDFNAVKVASLHESLDNDFPSTLELTKSHKLLTRESQTLDPTHTCVCVGGGHGGTLCPRLWGLVWYVRVRLRRRRRRRRRRRMSQLR
jgi:hypothetical protein